MSNFVQILSIWPYHGYFNLPKFHWFWRKIVIFSLMTYFWASSIFYESVFKSEFPAFPTHLHWTCNGKTRLETSSHNLCKLRIADLCTCLSSILEKLQLTSKILKIVLDFSASILPPFIRSRWKWQVHVTQKVLYLKKWGKSTLMSIVEWTYIRSNL